MMKVCLDRRSKNNHLYHFHRPRLFLQTVMGISILILYFILVSNSIVGSPLTSSTLQTLHQLTEFENVSSCFTATVPPCWTEMLQAQKQRKHPQHLQTQGEDFLHTRTYRLHSDK